MARYLYSGLLFMQMFTFYQYFQIILEYSIQSILAIFKIMELTQLNFLKQGMK